MHRSRPLGGQWQKWAQTIYLSSLTLTSLYSWRGLLLILLDLLIGFPQPLNKKMSRIKFFTHDAVISVAGGCAPWPVWIGCTVHWWCCQYRLRNDFFTMMAKKKSFVSDGCSLAIHEERASERHMSWAHYCVFCKKKELFYTVAMATIYNPNKLKAKGYAIFPAWFRRNWVRVMQEGTKSHETKELIYL